MVVRVYKLMKHQLFCFPWAGGNALGYQQWKKDLTGLVEVYPISLPGHGTRISEPLITDMALLLDHLYAELSPIWEDSFSFFGHSMGAVIATELTYRLQAVGKPLPKALFLSAHRAPQLPNETAHTHLLPESALLDYVKDMGGSPDSLWADRSLREMMLPIVRADFTALNTFTYQSRPPLPCPLIIMGGVKDAGLPRHKLAPWQELAGAEFSLHMFPGGHFYIQESYPMVLQFIKHRLTTLLTKEN